MTENEERQIKFEKEKHEYLEFEKRRRANRMKTPIENINFNKEVLNNLWKQESDYAKENYIGKAPSDEEFEKVEQELGYKLPNSYKVLMKKQNGGFLGELHCAFINEFDSYYTAPSEFWVRTILGVDLEKKYSVCGAMGTKFRIEEWGYPDIGVVIGEGISGAHDLFFLDYSDCGPEGEPCVVYIDQENEYKMIYVADNFQDFINGLISEDEVE